MRVGLLAIVASITASCLSPETADAAEKRVLHVYKSKREMVLVIGGERARTFRIGLGSAPEGDKKMQGDSRTPEGELYIAWKNKQSSFHRFLGLSYPMPWHAETAVERGLITKGQLARIAAAAKNKAVPPQDTRLGGYVGIHGGGSDFDWTLGCIAVTDEEAEFLFETMRAGDRVVVHP